MPEYVTNARSGTQSKGRDETTTVKRMDDGKTAMAKTAVAKTETEVTATVKMTTVKVRRVCLNQDSTSNNLPEIANPTLGTDKAAMNSFPNFYYSKRTAGKRKTAKIAMDKTSVVKTTTEKTACLCRLPERHWPIS